MSDTITCLLKHTTEGSEIRKLLTEKLETFKKLKEAGYLENVTENAFLNNELKKIIDKQKADIVANNQAYQSKTRYIDETLQEYKNRRRELKGTQILLDTILTNQKWHFGARQNLSKKIEANRKKFIGEFDLELKKVKHFREGGSINTTKPAGMQLNDDITRERARLNGAEIPETGNKVALEYAQALNNIDKRTQQIAKLYGIEIERNIGYAGKQTHSKTKLNQYGFDIWFDTLNKEVDIQKAPFVADKSIMLTIYHNLQNNSPLTGLDVFISMKKSLDDFKLNKTFPFKNPDAEIRYNKQFGYGGNQLQNSLSETNRLAIDMIVRGEFGSNPESTIRKIYNKYSSEEGADTIQLSKILTIFDEVRGYNEVGNESIAITGRNIRSLVSTTIYGSVAYTTPISDRMLMSFKAWQRNGGLGELAIKLPFNIIKGVGDTGEYIIKGIDPKRKGGLTIEEQKYLSEQGLGAQAMISAISRYFEDVQTLGAGQGISKMVDGINKVFSKVSNLEVKQNLDDALDFVTYAKELHQDLNIGAWEKLNPKRKAFLKASGINKLEYDVLKQLKIKKNEIYNEFLFSANEVQNLTNSQIQPLVLKKLKQDAGLKQSQELFDLTRYELENKIRTMFTSESFAQRGYKDERANILTRGTKAGTFAGETTRFIMQGKSFPLLFWDNVITSLYEQTSAKYNEKMGAFFAFAGASILGGYVVEQMNEIRNLKEPKELDKEMIVRSLVRSGVLGIFGDIVNASLSDALDISKTTGYQTKANLYKELLGLLGPSVGKGADLIEGINNLMAQNPNPDKLIKSIKSNIPGNNLFYISGMLNLITLELSQALGGKGKTKQERLLRQQKNIFGNRREMLFN